MANRQAVDGVRTGGRSARVREAVLSAAFDELIDNGYPALSVDAIAVRAGVNKTTIYRRWPTVEDLLVDALATWSLDVSVDETGHIETDLLALGTRLSGLLNGGVGRQVAAFVLTAGLRSPELHEATRRYFDIQASRAIPVIDRAINRGELPPHCDATTLLATLRAPLFYRMVTTGEPIDDELVAHSVRLTLAAARAGLLSS